MWRVFIVVLYDVLLSLACVVCSCHCLVRRVICVVILEQFDFRFRRFISTLSCMSNLNDKADSIKQKHLIK